MIVEPIDNHSLRVAVIDFTVEKLEDDSAWKSVHTSIDAVKHISLKET